MLIYSPRAEYLDRIKSKSKLIIILCESSYSNTYFCKWSWKMVAIVVHEVVTVTSEFFTEFVFYSFHIFFSEIGITNMDSLPEKHDFPTVLRFVAWSKMWLTKIDSRLFSVATNWPKLRKPKKKFDRVIRFGSNSMQLSDSYSTKFHCVLV